VSGPLALPEPSAPVALPGQVEMPTLAKPFDCCCSWSVIKPGPGLACVSRLTHVSGACPHKYAHLRAAAGGGS
jgi:hypothetical protein